MPPIEDPCTYAEFRLLLLITDVVSHDEQEARLLPNGRAFVARSLIEERLKSFRNDLDGFYLEDRLDELVESGYLLESLDGSGEVKVSELGALRLQVFLAEGKHEKQLLEEALSFDISHPRLSEKREATLRQISPTSNLIELCWQRVWDEHVSLMSAGSTTGLRDDSQRQSHLFVSEMDFRKAAAKKPEKKIALISVSQSVATKSVPFGLALAGAVSGHVPNIMIVGLGVVATGHVVRQFAEDAKYSLRLRVQRFLPSGGLTGQEAYDRLEHQLEERLGAFDAPSRTEVPERPADFKTVRETKGIEGPDVGNVGIA